jgi:hypothetical protein
MYVCTSVSHIKRDRTMSTMASANDKSYNLGGEIGMQNIALYSVDESKFPRSGFCKPILVRVPNSVTASRRQYGKYGK